MARELADFDALSFDCYGTLIDWESGIAAVLSPWASEVGLDLDRERLLIAYAGHEARTEWDRPTTLYPEVLAQSFRDTGAELGREVSDEWAERLGGSVPDWPAFPDSADALARLAERYALIILSNVDRTSFAGSNARLGVEFDAIVTAEDVGAYKPRLNHFERLDEVIADRGVPRDRLLHVAQSLFHDHGPAKQIGLSSAWINRRQADAGWGATPEPDAEYSYQWEFPSMAAFADAALG
ncbi:MAG TPA: haloacid dehalogenase type II [Nocardioidaceae bacterium]|nr:haloacid dehalogenase type II [Nocardioidaceae bacterium]